LGASIHREISWNRLMSLGRGFEAKLKIVISALFVG
jgi:hypothetical protein